jgi:hypothetical protein
MRFDPAADPWGTAMLAAAALWLLSLLVVVAALVARTPRRTGAWMMLVSLLAFLGAAAGGTWVRMQQADATAAVPAPPEPEPIVAKTPVAADEGLADGSSSGGTGGEPAEAEGGTTGGTADGETSTGAGSTGLTGGGATGAATEGSTGEAAAGSTGEAAVGSTGEPDETTGGDPTGGDEPDPAQTPTEPTRISEVVLPEAIPQVEPLPSEPRARDAAVREILEDAARAAGGGERCGNLQRVALAWAQLRMVPVTRKAKSITSDLERCRRRLLYSISQRQLAEHIEARDAFFDGLPGRIRKEHGLIVQASINGASHERLRIGNRELDAARADALMDAGLREELVRLEFARVVLSTGKKSKTYELDVTPESELGLPWLRAVGLGEPLKLTTE